MAEARDIQHLIDRVVANVEAARAVEKPFFHLEFDRVFPDDVYAAMIDADAEVGRLSSAARPQQGQYPRRRDLDPGEDRSLSRIHAPPAAGETRGVGSGRPRAVLGAGAGGLHAPAGSRAGTALRRAVRRHRHVPDPGADPRHSGLPHHARTPTRAGRASRCSSTCRATTRTRISAPSSTTVCPTARCRRPRRCGSRRNSGYAFAVGDNTWHSADPVGAEVETRDSILLTYFVDSGLLRFLRNRGKRVGNFVRNEVKHLTRQ